MPEEFVDAAEHAMSCEMGMKWRERADEFLETMSWDSVWSGMNGLIRESLTPRKSTVNAVAQINLQEKQHRV